MLLYSLELNTVIKTFSKSTSGHFIVAFKKFIFFQYFEIDNTAKINAFNVGLISCRFSFVSIFFSKRGLRQNSQPIKSA